MHSCILDSDPPVVFPRVLDGYADCIRRGSWRPFGPFDRQHPSSRDLVEPQLFTLASIIQAVQIDMKEWHAAAAILLHDRERRTADVFRPDAQPFRAAPYERRF